ncbi:hypothetical protein EMIHUDRAFT_103765 [Emiliania huxleyi CCMP1516]|uniref:Uncharacterized protein n=2 Tax=Emiliania huxleyi TaxID=2903 RepID=A0A0D3IQB9_EMIH1|nr:hypothetical protein EMIHUDRAFT_103765 [Emiliania huxleyi CCMP1516]EOD13454.1 hypothetical protein EMIHUDRAFT_103765 [Emiliania huxleyi CCMP1516]|eukprot:XP_005765883.1 hypothetical protein EMIHUDRAFT_103765 [Emiliania huxleyi CCMP1516]
MPSKPPGSKPRPQGTKRAKSQSPALALGGAAAAVAAVAYYVLTMSKAVSLSPSDSAALKQVFFSGEPWLVECGHSVSPAFYDAEGSLPKDLRVGLLDCAAALPSGKTTIQRFKLSPPKRGPTVLLFANADAKPAVAPVDAARTGVDLAKWAARVSQPRVVSVATVQLFEAHCTKRKWCALALGAGARLPSEERAALTKLAAAARAVRFIAVDGSKLLLPDELMRVGGELPEGFELLSETPTAEQRLPPPPPPRQEREEKSEEATRTLSDAELKALRAEREAERQRLEEERLEQRRAQMQEEEAMAGNLVEEVEEEGEAEEEADEAEEEVEVEEFE